MVAEVMRRHLRQVKSAASSLRKAPDCAKKRGAAKSKNQQNQLSESRSWLG
jgi:hypothetical protein